MTSKWIQSAPAASTAFTSSPKRAKSADRIDGEMMVVIVTPVFLPHAACGTDYLIGLLYALRFFLGYLRHGLGQSVRHEFIRVVTAHLSPIRLGHFLIADLGADFELRIAPRQRFFSGLSAGRAATPLLARP